MTNLSIQIDAAIAERAMLTHPFYQAWEEGALTREQLRVYAKQYFHHVEAFPRAVSAVHANCPDARGRKLLAENLAEEEGVAFGKDDHATLWLGFFAPGATPAPVVAKLSTDLGAVLRQPDVKQKLEDLGGEIVAMPHEAFAPRYRADVARWGKAIRELGIKLD